MNYWLSWAGLLLSFLLSLSVRVEPLTWIEYYGNIQNILKVDGLWHKLNFEDSITKASFVIFLKADAENNGGIKFWSENNLNVPYYICRILLQEFIVEYWSHQYVFPTILLQNNEILSEGFSAEIYKPGLLKLDKNKRIPHSLLFLLKRFPNRPEMCQDLETAEIMMCYCPFWRFYFSNHTILPKNCAISFGPSPPVLLSLCPGFMATCAQSYKKELTASNHCPNEVAYVESLRFNMDITVSEVIELYQRLKEWLLAQDFSPNILAFWLGRLLILVLERIGNSNQIFFAGANFETFSTLDRMTIILARSSCQTLPLT